MNDQKTKRCNPSTASIREWRSFLIDDSDNYRAFDEGISKRLAELEEQWAHFVTPAARRVGRCQQAS